MPKTYVTFGQDHIHKVNEKVVDQDCVAIIVCNDAIEGRKIAFELFGPKFCFEYHEDAFNHDIMRYFPRGYIGVN